MKNSVFISSITIKKHQLTKKGTTKKNEKMQQNMPIEVMHNIFTFYADELSDICEYFLRFFPALGVRLFDEVLCRKLTFSENALGKFFGSGSSLDYIIHSPSHEFLRRHGCSFSTLGDRIGFSVDVDCLDLISFSRKRLAQLREILGAVTVLEINPRGLFENDGTIENVLESETLGGFIKNPAHPSVLDSGCNTMFLEASNVDFVLNETYSIMMPPNVSNPFFICREMPGIYKLCGSTFCKMVEGSFSGSFEFLDNENNLRVIGFNYESPCEDAQ